MEAHSILCLSLIVNNSEVCLGHLIKCIKTLLLRYMCCVCCWQLLLFFVNISDYQLAHTCASWNINLYVIHRLKRAEVSWNMRRLCYFVQNFSNLSPASKPTILHRNRAAQFFKKVFKSSLRLSWLRQRIDQVFKYRDYEVQFSVFFLLLTLQRALQFFTGIESLSEKWSCSKEKNWVNKFYNRRMETTKRHFHYLQQEWTFTFKIIHGKSDDGVWSCMWLLNWKSFLFSSSPKLQYFTALRVLLLFIWFSNSILHSTSLICTVMIIHSLLLPLFRSISLEQHKHYMWASAVLQIAII